MNLGLNLSLGSGNRNRLPRTGLLFLSKDGVQDSIGVPPKQIFGPSPTTPPQPTLSASNVFYVNSTMIGFVGQYASYGIPIGNGTGTANDPFVSLSVAYSAITGTDNIVFVAGGVSGHEYTEALSWTTTGKAAHWVADGNVTLAGTDTRTLLITKEDQIFTGFTFPRSSNQIFWVSSNITITLFNCTINLTGTGEIRFDSGGSYTNTSYIFNNCTINVAIANTATAYTFIYDQPSSTSFDGCTLNIISCLKFCKVAETASPYTHSLEYKNGVVNVLGDRPDDSNGDIFTVAALAGGTYEFKFKNNIVTYGDISNVNDLANFIDIRGNESGVEDITSEIICNAFFAIAGDTKVRFAEAFNVTNNIDVKWNSYDYRSDNSMAMFFNGCSGLCSFTDNIAHGPVFYGNTHPTITHAVNFKGCQKPLFARNKVYGMCYAVVIKGTGNSGVNTLTAGGVFFNYIGDCTGPYIHPKGMMDVPVRNNTCINTGERGVVSDNGGIYFGINDPEFDNNIATGSVHNNIVAFFDSGASGLLIRTDAGCTTTRDRNCLYSTATGTFANIMGADYTSTGYFGSFEANGINDNPALVSSGGVLVLTSTSPCINAGANLFVNGDGDQYDADGYMVWSDDFDAPVYHWRDGVDSGAYAYGGSSKVYNNPVNVSGSGLTGTYTLPICPTLLDADDGTIYTSYVPNEIDLSSFVDSAWMRVGSKYWVAYSEDQDEATIAKIDKYIGNT